MDHYYRDEYVYGLTRNPGFITLARSVDRWFHPEGFAPRLYIRWTQLSAFCGLFLNGGHGERALWKRSQQELEIIRKFSWLHTELIPYFMF